MISDAKIVIIFMFVKENLIHIFHVITKVNKTAVKLY